MLGEQIANLPIGSVGLGTIKVVGMGVDATYPEADDKPARFFLRKYFSKIPQSKIDGCPSYHPSEPCIKIHDSHRSQSRITLRNSSPRNPTIMLYINHAFEQRTNLATTIEIE
jgi:hypothetical protein